MPALPLELGLERESWGLVEMHVRSARVIHATLVSLTHRLGARLVRLLDLGEEPCEDEAVIHDRRHVRNSLGVSHEEAEAVTGDLGDGAIATTNIATAAVTQTVVTSGVGSSANTPRSNVSIMTTTAITTVGGDVLVEAAVPVQVQKFVDATHPTASALATMSLERVSDAQ